MLRSLIALIAAALIGAPAHAEWLEASSPHFKIYGNISPKEMSQFADRLARFDAAMRRVLVAPADQTGGSDKLIIYVVDGVSTVQKLANAGNIAGYYHASAAGVYAVTPRSTEDRAFTQQVLFHEYVHHVTLGSNHGYYPSWAAEGIAEFFGTAKILPDGGVRVGIPNNARTNAILSESPMPVATLLSDRNFRGNDEMEQKYARSWLLVHYLLLGNPKRGGLNNYISLLNQGIPQPEAAQKAFGNLGELNAALDKYRQGKFFGADFTAANLKIDPIAIRKLDPGEAAMMPLRIRSATGVDDREAKALVAPARRIAATYLQNGWVQRVLAEIEFDAGNDTESEAACDAALAINPTDVDALIYKGRIHVRRVLGNQAATSAQWREARSWFLKANRIDPDLALPFVLFYDSFMLAKEPPSENAVTGLALAAALVPQDDDLRFKLTMALINKGDMQTAAKVLRPLAYRPHGGGNGAASKLLALLDSNADQATMKAKLEELLSKAPAAAGP